MRLNVIVCAISLALAAIAPARNRTIGNLVVSESSPSLTLTIDRRFKALPRLDFPIERLTNAERRIFIEAGPGNTVQRMIVIQFEKVQSGSDFRFRYPSRPPRDFGGATYRFGTFAYDDEKTAAAEPAKEAGRTRAHLLASGYRPARFYKVARLARVTDPQGMSEVIIFYMENADRQFGHGPLPSVNEDGDLPVEAADKDRLFKALTDTVHVVKGDSNGSLR